MLKYRYLCSSSHLASLYDDRLSYRHSFLYVWFDDTLHKLVVQNILILSLSQLFSFVIRDRRKQMQAEIIKNDNQWHIEAVYYNIWAKI